MKRKGKDTPGHSFSTPAAAKAFKDRNLMKVNPLKEQFEPTTAAPVRQHVKMAGGG